MRFAVLEWLLLFSVLLSGKALWFAGAIIGGLEANITSFAFKLINVGLVQLP